MTDADEQRRAQIRAVAEQRAKRRAETRASERPVPRHPPGHNATQLLEHHKVVAALLVRLVGADFARYTVELTGDELDATEGALSIHRSPTRDGLVVEFTRAAALPQPDEGEGEEGTHAAPARFFLDGPLTPSEQRQFAPSNLDDAKHDDEDSETVAEEVDG